MTSARTSPRVLSLNVGAVREVEWRGKRIATAIWKSPVPGRIALRGVNFAGDDQADRRVHGGPDKAVYAYAREDYDWWREHEGLATEPALFGENLTVEGLDLGGALVGERWEVGSATLEVAQPRMPCFKLGIRVGDQRFLERFLTARRPGAYLRVLREGEVAAGDEIRVVSRPAHAVTLRFMLAALDDDEKVAALRELEYLPAFWARVAGR